MIIRLLCVYEFFVQYNVCLLYHIPQIVAVYYLINFGF